MGSARTSPVETVLAGIVTTLKADAGVAALVSTRIFNNVPQDTAYPYLEVTCPTDRPEDTCGAFGAMLLVDVKAVSQFFGDREAARILNASITALNFQTPALTGHVTLGLTWDSSDRFREIVNGIVTRHHVATFRAWTTQ